MNKKIIRVIIGMIFLIALVLFGLIFVDSAFISAFMLWLSLFVFSICFYLKDSNKKKTIIFLYVVGILLIIGAIVYMIVRLT